MRVKQEPLEPVSSGEATVYSWPPNMWISLLLLVDFFPQTLCFRKANNAGLHVNLSATAVSYGHVRAASYQTDSGCQCVRRPSFPGQLDTPVSGGGASLNNNEQIISECHLLTEWPIDLWL